MDEETSQLQFNDGSKGENSKYKVEKILDSAVYARDLEDLLLNLYYLVYTKTTLRK